MSAQLRLGLQIVPTMPVTEMVETVRVAENLGFEFAMVADEGLMHDVYVVLALMAEGTSRIRLGAVTNGYTRHPAATAAAMATIDDLSAGRAFLTLVAGGTMVLEPLGLVRERPLAVVRESVEMMRRLWSGETVTWEGEMFSLADARLEAGNARDIPIWIAARGPRLLQLAGEVADGAVVMGKGDLGAALGIVNQGDAARSDDFARIYLDRLAFTPEMLAEAKYLYSYALMDSPDRMLRNIGLDQTQIDRLADAIRTGGPSAVTELVTDEMVEGYQVVGTRDECGRILKRLADNHRLDVFMVNIISAGLDANRDLLTDIVAMTDNWENDR